MNPLRVIIRQFDDWLSHREGVEPFTDDPSCILRLQTGELNHSLELPTAMIPTGVKVLLLHVWNERTPSIPPEGPDFAYGLVARHILSSPALQDVQAVGGVTAHVSLKKADGGRAMLEHLGFTVLPYHRPFGAFGEFWENFYTWWLMWTYNFPSVRHRKLWNLQRTEFWMTKNEFLKKYG